jgi:hypothetical protein
MRKKKRIQGRGEIERDQLAFVLARHAGRGQAAVRHSGTKI